MVLKVLIMMERLIVSCTNLIVAPGNLSIMPSIGMLVFTISKRLHVYFMRYNILKIMVPCIMDMKQSD